MKIPGPTDAQREAVEVLSRTAKQNQSEAGRRYGRGKPKGIAFPKIEKTHMDDELARMFNVSKGYIHEAQRLKRFCDEFHHPELIEKVWSGAISLPEAKRRVQGIIACMQVSGDTRVSREVPERLESK